MSSNPYKNSPVTPCLFISVRSARPMPAYQPITAFPASSVLKMLASSLVWGGILLLVFLGLVRRVGILRSVGGGGVSLTHRIEKSKGTNTHLFRNIYPEFPSNSVQKTLLRRRINHTLSYLRPGGTGVDEYDGGF